MIIRIGVGTKGLKNLNYGQTNVSVYIIDVKHPFAQEELKKISQLLVNPVIQEFYTFVYDENNLNYKSFDTRNNYNLINDLNANWSLEIAFLPGVTDNVGNIAKQMISESLNYSFNIEEGVYSAQVIFGQGELPTAEEIAEKYNPLIQYCKLSHKNNDGGFHVLLFGNQNIMNLNNLYSSSANKKSIFPIPYVRHQDLFFKKKNLISTS